MSDIVTARCAACGHSVKVPAALGGKKAKCPQCAQVITIPTAPDPGGEFVSDDQLPEVARDEDILEGLPAEDEEIVEGEPVDERPLSGRRMALTPRRGTPTPGGAAGRLRGSGGYPRVPGRGSGRSPRESSSATKVIVVGIAAAAVLAIVLVVMLGGGGRRGGSAGKGEGEKTSPSPSPPQFTEADAALQKRCLEYIAAFNRGNVLEIVKFYSYAPNEEQSLKAAISALLEQGIRYDDVGFKATSAAAGTLTFVHSKGERTMNWKEIGGVWLIVDRP